MNDFDFEMLQAKVLEAESLDRFREGRAGLPPPGWSPAKAAAHAIGDRSSATGMAGGPASRPDPDQYGERFGHLNGSMFCNLYRLEARILRQKPRRKLGQAAPVLHLYGMEGPIELDDSNEAGGAALPFRLTEAKISNSKTGTGSFFTRIRSNGANSSVVLFSN
eukprot:TRINITY_DN72114_c0_g1_i1.p1 TRINITY_DN72114_c0_g1~~TRINITY_DN72114_c0_g1_i1.p1  ORF type:complete len:164 (-),score=25.84 TRINITY_DN72114_c0_g1_i1:92-583(-)